MRSLAIKCVACDDGGLIEVPLTSAGKRLFFASCKCGARYTVTMDSPGDVAWHGRR